MRYGRAAGARTGRARARAACTIRGTITGLRGPLPGVSITVRRNDTVRSASSTDIDGTFKLTLPDASYQLTAELTGFVTDSEGGHRHQGDVCADRQLDDNAHARLRTTGSTLQAPPNGRGFGPERPTGWRTARGGRKR